MACACTRAFCLCAFCAGDLVFDLLKLCTDGASTYDLHADLVVNSAGLHAVQVSLLFTSMFMVLCFFFRVCICSVFSCSCLVSSFVCVRMQKRIIRLYKEWLVLRACALGRKSAI